MQHHRFIFKKTLAVLECSHYNANVNAMKYIIIEKLYINLYATTLLYSSIICYSPFVRSKTDDRNSRGKQGSTSYTAYWPPHVFASQQSVNVSCAGPVNVACVVLVVSNDLIKTFLSINVIILLILILIHICQSPGRQVTPTHTHKKHRSLINIRQTLPHRLSEFLPLGLPLWKFGVWHRTQTQEWEQFHNCT